MLKRSLQSPQGGLWTAAPGGKLEKGETPLSAAVREVLEETGLNLDRNKLTYKGEFYFRFPDVEFVLHVFHCHLDRFSKIVLDPNEHSEFQWTSVSEALQMPLMRGGIECLNTVFPDK